jgi:hypothetical protein
MNHQERLIARLFCGIFFVGVLVGCATNSPALRESQELTSQGRLDEALVRLENALKENPNNAELRLAVAQTRERISPRASFSKCRNK